MREEQIDAPLDETVTRPKVEWTEAHRSGLHRGLATSRSCDKETGLGHSVWIGGAVMSTADDLIKEVQAGFSGMANDLDALDDFTGLLCVLLTAPDFEECLGLHRLILVIPDHLRAVKDRQVSASKAIRRLANP